jgi:hypothetical protein
LHGGPHDGELWPKLTTPWRLYLRASGYEFYLRFKLQPLDGFVHYGFVDSPF